VSPEERRRSKEAEAQKRAEEERRQQQAAAARLAEEERQREAEDEHRRKTAAEAERQRLERDAAAEREAEERRKKEKKAEDERRRAEEERRHQEAEARRKVEQEQAFAAVKRADSVGTVDAFLAAHPESHLAGDARALRAALIFREDAYNKAMAGDDPAVLKAFLASYKKGPASDQVRGRLRRLEPQRSRRPLLMAGTFGVLLIGAISLWLADAYWTPAPPKQTPAQPSLTTVSPAADAEAKRRADEAEQQRQAALKAEEDAKRVAEAKAAADAEAKRRADEAEQQRQPALKAEEERKRAEVDARRDPALAVIPGSGQSFQDRLANGQPCPICPEMVVVPAGSFTMGSPASELQREATEVQVRVTIARPFAVGRFPVTFAEWDACVADGGCEGYRPDDQGWGRDRRPVINVNWDDTKLYIDWLNAKTGKTYRLQSETEREYVTRAGTTTPFWWGSSITPKQANYNGNHPFGGGTKGEYRQQTVPVDSFDANPWGLFDVHGNVSEWTEDCWYDSNQGNPGNGSARTTGDCGLRVVRGGSWYGYPGDLRSAYRFWNSTGLRADHLGFRVARTLNP
jgi:formylglycine-generating enzyme required for sulfatase activity